MMIMIVSKTLIYVHGFNILRPGQNGHYFADDIFLINENDYILIHISVKFVPNGLINDNPAWV